VGVGANIDLSVVGRRNPETDPFAVGGPPVAHTEEKQKPKTKEREVTPTNPFEDIKVTGKEGKGDIPPSNTMNVSDETEQPAVPSGQTSPKDKVATATVEDLKNAHDAYLNGLTKFTEADPNWNKLVATANTTQELTPDVKKKVDKAKKKIQQLKNQFNQSDEGKKLLADYKTTYDNAIKSGEKVGNELIPPATNDLEKKKYAVAETQNDLKQQQDKYDQAKQNAIDGNDDVKNIRTQIEAIENQYKPSKESKLAAQEKINQLKDDLVKAQQKAGNDWAASNDAKQQMQKVHEAEQEVDKAKQAYKPFEQFEEKPAKAASNP
jgi:chromosome segregation ATPase